MLIKSMGIGTTKIHLQLPKTMVLPQKMLKITFSNHQMRYTVLYLLCYSHVIRMSSLRQSYVLVCHLYAIRMYSYVNRMHSYVALP